MPLIKLPRHLKTPRILSALVACSLLAASDMTNAENYIALAEQATSKILVMDYTQKNWDSSNSSAVKWNWQPSDSGISSEGWKLPNDARLRYNKTWGGEWVAIVAGYGRLAVVSYPGKIKKWSINIGSKPNVHGIELLPDGNVAVAASTGGWVRVYTASQGESSETYVQYNLPDAHNVLWDPARKTLWALGKDKLVQLRLEGTPANPTLTQTAVTTLPVGSGHDLEPKYGDPNTLWLTMGSSTWTFDKTQNKATLFQKVAGYKSINNQSATGQIIETKPHASCTNSSWCTDVIEFYSPADIRTRIGAAIYRARVWDPDYQ
jgi:hypothetical protein